MKNFILILSFVCGMSTFANAVPNLCYDFQFQVVPVKPTLGGGHPLPKSPVASLDATLDDHQLILPTLHPEYTLYLVDEDEEIAYQVVVPENFEEVNIPSMLVGNFQLLLYPGGDYYFYYDIVL